MIKVNEIIVPLEKYKDLEFLKLAVCKKLNIQLKDIKTFSISRRSIDARKKNNIHYKFNFNIALSDDLENFLVENKKATKVNENINEEIKLKTNKKVLIVGSGPSGLFCALKLALSGVKVIVVERGECVEKRVKTVEKLLKTGDFKQNSNIQYGEGGAGTFSDGKLNTGINSPLVDEVLKTFNKFGAPEEILYDAKPHIGTDKLRDVVRNLRTKIISLGGEFLFETTFIDFEKLNEKMIAYVQNVHTSKIVVDDIVLAFGYSARDTIRHLNNKGLEFKQKAFSVGYRIEHLQEEINKSQYGGGYNKKYLPPADYKLFAHLPNGRTVYTFCMCPGGVVVPSMSEKGQIVTNGMSYHARDGINANSAVLVSVNTTDYESSDPLSGLEYQEKLEINAYNKTNGKFICSTVGDFFKRRKTTKLQSVVPSIKPCYNLGNVFELLPEELAESIILGIKEMGKKLKGFDNPESVLTGIETRSSAPFMIPRNKETLETNIKNIYAIGEGAGMAGGIVSSAVDGLKIATKIIEKYAKE